MTMNSGGKGTSHAMKILKEEKTLCLDMEGELRRKLNEQCMS